MNFIKRGLFYGSASIILPYGWHKIGLYDVDNVRNNSFNNGLKISQKFKQYPVWDRVVEPFLVKQSTVLFTVGHSFMEGMASDNKNQENIKEVIEKAEQLMKKEMDSNNNNL
jgi:hypothetical protein